ncbi:hypothetical protein NEMIN01_1039 [Nematocida minor]|uniref:uncharacterized protein n=1 Tax=Nematocida minor TaxID=1912983 RepID=UPI00221ED368|nr:uncharacterized protein NEMIN01_1039 [Nematocida minor]KAI5190415.1 hypothetical protein NEMIN01_1039 [Nematocida minor]
MAYKKYLALHGIVVLVFLFFNESVEGIKLDPLKKIRNKQSSKLKPLDDSFFESSFLKESISKKTSAKTKAAPDSDSDAKPQTSSKSSTKPSTKSKSPIVADDEESTEKTKEAPSKSSKKTDKKGKTAAVEAEEEAEEDVPEKPSAISAFFDSNIVKIVLYSAAGAVVAFVFLFFLLFYISNYLTERSNRRQYMQSLKPAYTSTGDKKDTILAAINL